VCGELAARKARAGLELHDCSFVQSRDPAVRLAGQCLGVGGGEEMGQDRRSDTVTLSERLAANAGEAD
jgi:hypothetical protein